MPPVGGLSVVGHEIRLLLMWTPEPDGGITAKEIPVGLIRGGGKLEGERGVEWMEWDERRWVEG